jgi:sugar lactone lactonase YvrE
LAACAAVLLAIAVGTPAGAQAPYTTSLFARVPDPGQPEGIAVASDGTVYAGTNNAGDGTRRPRTPSKIFSYDSKGAQSTEYPVLGQDLTNDMYGVYGLATDNSGNVYFADRAPPRIVKLDAKTGAQSDYARLPDIKPCSGAPAGAPCSKTTADQAPFPNALAFGPSGSLYVTDALQAAVWRILPGGGEPTLVRSDPLLEAAVAGPNGIFIDPDGKTMTFAQSNFPPGPTPELANGRIYRLPLSGEGDLKLVWEGKPFDVPDGIALAKSGNIWVALSGPDQMMVLDPAGKEIARFPSMTENSQQEVPYDKPASVAFLGKRALVTNQSLFNRDSTHWAILAVDAREEGQQPFRPGGKMKVKLATPRRVRVGLRRFALGVTRASDGVGVGGARVAIGRGRTGTNIAGSAKMQVRLTQSGLRKIVVTAPGYDRVTLHFRVLPRRR